MSKRVSIIITGVGSGVAQSIIKALKYANMQNDRNYFLITELCASATAGTAEKNYFLPFSTSFLADSANLCPTISAQVLLGEDLS